MDLEFIDNQVTELKLNLTEEERLAKLNKLFGAWKNQDDLTEIFAEIDQQRHAYRGRNIESIVTLSNNYLSTEPKRYRGTEKRE
jgi:antitoxin ParD1/3/4